MNKKAVSLSITTVILIVLGLLVLIGLLILINSQTGFFSDILNNLLGRSNVDSVVLSCNTFFNSQSFFIYCCDKKTVITGDEKMKLTCFELSEKEFIGGRINKLDCEGFPCAD
jgi:hypothetical protein